MFNIKRYIILISITLLLNISSSAYSAGNSAKSDGRDDFSYLKAKNSNLKKGHDALKQAKKYEKNWRLKKQKKDLMMQLIFFL